MNQLVVISGCSGGGKSTLLAELATRGFDTVEEPGRRIVRAERAEGGNALPWLDEEAFAKKAAVLATNDYRAAKSLKGSVFFDRSLIDAMSFLHHAQVDAPGLCSAPILRGYHPEVFMAPPWQEIYHHDDERRHDFKMAVEEYERLMESYAHFGYSCTILPKIDVATRAEFILGRLN